MNESNWLVWALWIMTAILAWIGKKLHERVEVLEREGATTDQMQKASDTIREDVNALRARMDQKFDDLHRHIMDSMRDRR